MDITSARLIYFSPTKTTQKVLDGIARGLGFSSVEHVDLTDPEAARKEYAPIRGELAVLATPVYGGRVPGIAAARLQRLQGENAPAVVVVVYGNRAYEDALLELRDLARASGFKPVAAAAFIAQHSYSSDATPVAVGRPDAGDMSLAEAFGKNVAAKLQGLQDLDAAETIAVPGNFPYKERKVMPVVAPVTYEETCTKCGECVPVCPTEAVTCDDDGVKTDATLCIRCMACVRACPTGARVMEAPHILQAAQWLTTNCREPKAPETYL
ncbi:4Fe-4S binding protein [Fundidesulfovibrio butyratiphilus]